MNNFNQSFFSLRIQTKRKCNLLLEYFQWMFFSYVIRISPLVNLMKNFFLPRNWNQNVKMDFKTFWVFCSQKKKGFNKLQNTNLLLSQSPRSTLEFSFTFSLDSFHPFFNAFNLMSTLKPVLFVKISSAFLIKKRPPEQRTFFLDDLKF